MTSNIIQSNSYYKDVIAVDMLKNFWKDTSSDSNYPYLIKITYFNSSNNTNLHYSSAETRDSDYEKILNLAKGRSINMIDSVKTYLKKHEDTIITIIILILIDHFIFNGAFRDKLNKIVETMISKVTKKIEET